MSSVPEGLKTITGADARRWVSHIPDFTRGEVQGEEDARIWPVKRVIGRQA